MSNKLINIQNTRYTQVTQQKGNLGIGTPYQVLSEYPGEIVVPQSTIQTKLAQLSILRNGYSNASIATLRSAFGGGDGGGAEDRLIDGFKKRLRDILFPIEQPPVVAGDAILSYFNGYRRDFANIDPARDYIVVVLGTWIDLFNRILNNEQNLSRPQPTGTPATELLKVYAPVADSAVNNFSVGAIDVKIESYRIPIADALVSSSTDLIFSKTLQFFDEQREYKTVLNFGNDRQYLVEAWRRTTRPNTVQLKLIKPLKGDIELYNTPAYIARDFAQPVIDTITVELEPPIDDSLSLRPANMDVGKFSVNKQLIKNQTLATLGTLTGSLGYISASTITYDDRTFNRWYTADFNSSQLNVNFEDYNNFVFFGSAKARLNAFANKLNKIQSYPNTISLNSSNTAERNLAIEQENIKRNFDIYEQYLYFASMSSAYSASVDYVDGGVEYNPTGSWPKDSNMNPLVYTSVQDWYTSQSAIAERFDEFNPNYLVKHLPQHIQEDVNSEDFIKFIQMFGHVMDNIKVYIDQFSNIYSTNPDPFKELSMDQVYEVGKSFGLELPNAHSLEALNSFISSLYDGVGVQSLLAETWKRFIHSSVYLRQLKGTRTGVDSVINTFGINSPLVQVKESTYATEGNYIKSDELVYALQFTGSLSSSIRIPLVSSSFTASTLQVRFTPELRRESSLLSSNGTWAVDLVPHPSSSTYTIFNNGLSKYVVEVPTVNYGKINVVSGSSRVVIASSSYFPLFSTDYTHIMLRSQSRDIVIIQTDGDQILFQQSSSMLGSVNWANLWNTTHVFLGASGSIKKSVFDGIIDDVRVWSEEITIDNFIKQAYDPGAYYGSNYSASYNSLLVDLSFSQPYLAITQSATNESPFVSASHISNLPVTPINSLTTESYVRVSRTIKQFTPIVGSSIFSNKKITVAPPPVFTTDFIDENGTQMLLPKQSIKPVEEKRYVGGTDYVQFAVSPTDFINQTILRSMGDIDTNYLIGSPSKYNRERYPELDNILEFFLENYNDNINVNQYIRFFKNVLKAPSEYIESYVPARSNLIDGIVIESSILDRRKTYVQKAIRVDGSNTRTFENFVSGSGSANVGAYDFLAHYPRAEEPNTTIIKKPIIQKIGLYDYTSSLYSDTGIGTIDTVFDNTTVGPVSSTSPYTDLPRHKQYLQYIGSYLVSSSLADPNSGIGFVDSVVSAEPRNIVTQSGYARDVFKGLLDNESSTYRIQPELNTLLPFYEIPPLCDFSDPGSTNYFYKDSGVYRFATLNRNPKDSITQKQFYRAKLDVPIGEIGSLITKELFPVKLLSASRLTDYPGRSKITISQKTYTSTPYKGLLNIANIFSLYSIKGTTGLRIRLYSSQTSQESDISRDFSILPTPGSGVLFDGLLTEKTDVFPYTLIQTENSTIYFTINNITSNNITAVVDLSCFEYEPANLVPIGYLPRHYKFNRDNGIAQKRRNHLGCKLIYCPEGCPPGVVQTETEPPFEGFFAPSPTTPKVDKRGGTNPKGPLK
jgi:hypothetical protein